MKNGFANNIEDLTLENKNFREVLYTGKNMQLVLMTLQAGEEIGEEVHEDGDQFFRFEKGKGEVWIDGVCHKVKKEYAVIIPAGALHNVINTGDKPLKMYTLYAPPEHIDKTIHATKQDAINTPEHWDGKTTE